MSSIIILSFILTILFVLYPRLVTFLNRDRDAIVRFSVRRLYLFAWKGGGFAPANGTCPNLGAMPSHREVCGALSGRSYLPRPGTTPNYKVKSSPQRILFLSSSHHKQSECLPTALHLKIVLLTSFLQTSRCSSESSCYHSLEYQTADLFL